MKINKKIILNGLLIALDKIVGSHGANVRITEAELNNFKYGADEFTMNIIGDTGTEKEAKQVMNLFKFDAMLHLGDYDYICKPDAYFDNILDSKRSYKFLGILGNHESAGECGKSKYNRYVSLLYNQMVSSRNSGVSCTFSPKKTMWSCKYKNMRIIGLSPTISEDEKRKDQLEFLKKHLSRSTEDWKICAWHYYDDYYHTGKYIKNKNYVSGDGENFYDYCRLHGAIIFSAHDHVYARTKVMTKFSSPQIDSYDKKTSSNIVQIRKGATLNILNAVGGWEIYIEQGKYKSFSHWQKKYARGDKSENAKKYGSLKCKFNVGGNNKKAQCEFLRINSNPAVFDSFTIYRNDDPKNISYNSIDSKFLQEKVSAYESKNYGKQISAKSNSGNKTSNVKKTTTRNTKTTSNKNKTTSRNNKSSGNKTIIGNNNIKISNSKRCGPEYGRCKNGYCCSKYGYCNTTDEHCDVNQGCQKEYGTCKVFKTVKKSSTTKKTTKKSSTKKTTKKSSSTKRKASTKRKTTTKKSSSIGYSSSDKCGPSYGKCRNSKCCSKYGWCGSSSDYCKSGCQSLYGKCW